MGQPYEKSSKHMSFKRIATNNFVGGVFWALGATVGLALIFVVLGMISKSVNVVPVFGTFVSQIIDFVLKHNPNLQR